MTGACSSRWLLRSSRPWWAMIEGAACRSCLFLGVPLSGASQCVTITRCSRLPASSGPDRWAGRVVRCPDDGAEVPQLADGATLDLVLRPAQRSQRSLRRKQGGFPASLPGGRLDTARTAPEFRHIPSQLHRRADDGRSSPSRPATSRACPGPRRNRVADRGGPCVVRKSRRNPSRKRRRNPSGRPSRPVTRPGRLLGRGSQLTQCGARRRRRGPVCQ